MKENITGKRIATLRKSAGLSQEKFAMEIDEAPTTCHMWETGSRTLSKFSQAIKIAKFFNCSLEYLAGMSDLVTSDQDAGTTCRYTGLSENAVKVLHYLHTTEDVNNVNSQNVDLINAVLENEYQKCKPLYDGIPSMTVSMPVVTLFTKMMQYIKGTKRNEPVIVSADIPSALDSNNVYRRFFLDGINEDLKQLADEYDMKK